MFYFCVGVIITIYLYIIENIKTKNSFELLFLLFPVFYIYTIGPAFQYGVGSDYFHYLRMYTVEVEERLFYAGEYSFYYIVKFLIGDDRDLRIFAINVLGDVEFEESRTLLLELIKEEKDINVAMTAVDYLAEIGQPDDIATLKALEARFPGEAYVSFAINNAISLIEG